MAVTYGPTLTRSATCRKCAATVGLYPSHLTVPNLAVTVRPASNYDAVAVVGRGLAVHALPTVDPTVRWECPACDAPN